jgi:replicative DNA helicase
MASERENFEKSPDATYQRAPYDIEIEQALLGSFFVNNQTIAIARSIIRPEHFYDPFHHMLAELMFEFDEEGKVISPLTIHAWAKHWKGTVEVGGHAYFAGLAQAAPAVPNIVDLCLILVDLAQRRQAKAAIEDAMDGLLSARAIMPSLAGVVEIADEISAAQMTAKTHTGVAQIGHDLLRGIEEQAKKGEVFGVRTDIEQLDDLLGGLYPENLIIIGGRPGMGKSILACRLLLTAARQGYAGDYYSIEMPGREVLARMQCDIDYEHAIQHGVKPMEYQDLVKMRADQEMIHRAALANRTLGELELDIFTQDRITMQEIAAISRARAARGRGRKRIVIIDHLHIIMPGTRYQGRRVDELSEITGAAKRLAKRIESPVVLLAQLSRDLERRDDKRPFMSDFRDSGSIEQDADVVMSVYRGQYYAEAAIRQAKNDEQRVKAQAEEELTKNVLEIGVLKQRSGATATARCFIDVNSSVVRSFDPRVTLGARQTGLWKGQEPLDNLKS